MQKKKEKKKRPKGLMERKEKELEGLAITPEDVTSLLPRILRLSRVLFYFIFDGVRSACGRSLLLTNMRHRRVGREDGRGRVGKEGRGGKRCQ